MKRMFVAVLAGVVLWSGVWWWQAAALRGQVDDWMAARQASGWEARYDSQRVRGYPTRLDLTISGLTVYDPQADLRWETPFVQVLGLIYRPGHKILIWPDSQSLTLAGTRHTLASQRLRGSVVHTAEGEILRMNLEADSLQVTEPTTGAAFMDLRAALHVMDANTPLYRLGTQARLATGTASVQAEITFDQRWMLDALHMPRPQPKVWDTRQSEWQGQGIKMTFAGTGTLDGAGRLSGDLTATATGKLGEDGTGIALLDALANALAEQRQTTGDPSLLLRLLDGSVTLGPEPLGNMPALHLP